MINGVWAISAGNSPDGEEAFFEYFDGEKFVTGPHLPDFFLAHCQVATITMSDSQ